MKKILLIDDDKAIHQFVQTILDPNEYQFMSAYDPTQAFVFIRKDKPDLILLDIHMPAGGGMELFKRLKSIPQTSRIPILILSALDKGKLEKQVELKSLTIMSKPISKEDLTAGIEETLKKGA